MMSYFSTYIFIIILSTKGAHGALLLKCPFSDLDLGHKVTENYEVVYVRTGEMITIPCCQRRHTAKQTWIIRDRFFFNHSQIIKIAPGKTASHDSRIYVDEQANLTILSMVPELSSAYYCKSTQDGFEYDPNTYVYFIDVQNQDQKTEEGGIQTYLEYRKKYLDPVERYLKKSRDLNFKLLRQVTGLGIAIKLEWSPWTACDTCIGERTRLGRCRLVPYVIDPAKCTILCEMFKYSFNMECASTWTFERWFAVLARKTKSIPNFKSVAKCVSSCSHVKTIIKKRRTHFIFVSDSLVLRCPFYKRKKDCFWLRNGIKLQVDEYEPSQKVSVNEFCTLYIFDATTKESGNFTCLVDKVHVQENKVLVQENYVEKKAAWWRHIQYLMYIVLACFVILIGGIGIACVQRNNFIKIDAERELQAYHEKQPEYQKLLPNE